MTGPMMRQMAAASAAAFAALVLANQSWGALTIPVAVAVLLAAAGALAVGWDRRPWATGQ